MPIPIPPQNAKRSLSIPSVLWFAIIIAFLLALAPLFFDSHLLDLSDHWLVGPDAYSRVLRVQDWWSLGEWYNSTSPRSNWPYGDVSHWTRPLDILLVLLALPLTPFMEVADAIYIAGVLISPLLLLPLLGVMLWGFQPYLNRNGQVILVLLLIFQPILYYYFSAARPDHHSLILLCFGAVFALLCRHAANPEHEKSAITWAGIALGLGMWISLETLTFELFALMSLGLAWIWKGERVWLLALHRFTYVSAITLAISLCLERPPSEWLTSHEYDRISTVHVVLFALIALGVMAVWRFRKRVNSTSTTRFFALAVAGSITGLFMAVLYPDFFKGPLGATMEPKLYDLWLSKIHEFHSLAIYDGASLIRTILIVGPLIWFVVWLVTLRNRAAQDTRMALPLTIAVLIYLPLAISQLRWGGYLGIVIVPAWVIIMQRVLDWHGGPLIGADTPTLRIPAFIGVSLGHVIIVAGIQLAIPDDALSKPNKTCHWQDISPYLNSPEFAGGKPQTIFSFIHEGPEILYRTPHRVVGTPYHRNRQGLLDTFNIFMSTDNHRAKALLNARDVDYVLTCKGSTEEKFFLKFKGDTLMQKITTGRQPSWLIPAPPPDELTPYFHLFKVKN